MRSKFEVYSHGNFRKVNEVIWDCDRYLYLWSKQFGKTDYRFVPFKKELTLVDTKSPLVVEHKDYVIFA